MPIHNSDVADILNKVADLLDIKGDNPFRIRAYRNAARAVNASSKNVSDMVAKKGDLSALQGIGKDLAQKITEIVQSGKLPLLDELEKEVPIELSAMMKIQGLGPKRIKKISQEMNIQSVDELREAAKQGKIRDLLGFGEKTERAIIEEIDRMEQQKKEGKERLKLAVAEQIAGPLLEYLIGIKSIKDIAIAGSYRRRRETVGDLDILVTCKKYSDIMDRFVGYEDVEKVIARGKTKSSVILRQGLQVDLRVVPQVSYGAALLYFTGSKEHNIAVRKIAQKKGLKINEYGVFEEDKRIAGKTEKQVYEHVELPYIQPELRENRGETEAARKGNLPDLITLDSIKGDLHVHTKETDGHHSLEEMAHAAQKKGYEYIAITDHSRHVTVANGLDEKRLSRQIDRIERFNDDKEKILVLKSIELDILEDGSLDLSDDIIERLDLVLCSVHSKFNLSSQKQTERIIRAMDNPFFNILCHPSGRLINERPPYEVDMEKVIRAAKERGCFLELNAHPDRLDLNDIHCKMAKDIGVKVAIATDAHRIDDLKWMTCGIGQARRGWLESADVLNTLSWKELKKLIRRK
jgi:DNA polymerase (family 10)